MKSQLYYVNIIQDYFQTIFKSIFYHLKIQILKLNRKGVVHIEFKKVEEGIVSIYENETKERLINARELHEALGSNTKFAD